MTVKKSANCNDINSVNFLCLIIDETIAHFEEENKIKHLVLDDVEQRNF